MQTPGLDKHLVASVYTQTYAAFKQRTAPLRFGIWVMPSKVIIIFFVGDYGISSQQS